MTLVRIFIYFFALHTNSTILTTCGVEMDFGEVKNNRCQVT